MGYTGLGSASTSAVGLVSILPVPGTPEALVKGTAYGQLHVSAAAGPRSVLLAADAPTRPGKEPPHEIHVHVVRLEGGYTFWGTDHDIGWCRIEAPEVPVEVPPGEPTPQLTARVFDEGVTPGDGAGEGLMVQVGYGPDGADRRPPRRD